MRRLTGLLAAALLLIAAAPARAGIASAPGRDLEVELVTYGPGRVYWERFGHDAIILRDTRSGEAVSFNYGVFDFDVPHFFLRFIRGHLLYSMAAEYAGPEIAGYIAAGRAVRVQRLALDPAQASALRDFLLWNLEPQHRRYRYDYFTDNCATRVRDALNRALGGALFTHTQAPAGGRSFRTQVGRMLAHDPPLLLLVDLGLGPYADRPLTLWQDAFLPMTLADLVQRVRLPGAGAAAHPLVTADRQVYAGTVRMPPAAPPQLLPPLLGIGLAWAAPIVLGARARAGRAARFAAAAAAALYALLAGLAGLVMLALWAFTSHRAAWANQNLLQLSPGLLLLIVPLARALATGRAPMRWALGLTLLLAGLGTLGLIGHLLGLLDQRNLHWIAFALPVDLALAAAAWRTRAR